MLILDTMLASPVHMQRLVTFSVEFSEQFHEIIRRTGFVGIWRFDSFLWEWGEALESASLISYCF